MFLRFVIRMERQGKMLVERYGRSGGSLEFGTLSTKVALHKMPTSIV